MLAVGLGLAGCGGHGSSPAGSASATAPSGPVQPHIATPANGDALTAAGGGADLRTQVAVSGTAQPRTRLVISADCQLAGCSTNVTADAGGRFSGAVEASVPAATPRATIVVAYETADAVDSDRVVVSLQAPVAATPTPTRRPRSKRISKSAKPLPSVTVTPPAATPSPIATAAPTSAAGGSGSGTVVVIGDSLAEGIKPYLPSALPGWRVSIDARVGRPLAEGMGIFAATSIAAGTVYAFSLFTNDDPRSVGALESAVRTSVQRGGCAVWATIVRPPVGGVSYAAANQRLSQLASTLAPRLQIADWAAAVRANPGWIAGADGVHATAEGYRNRAALYAEAIRACVR